VVDQVCRIHLLSYTITCPPGFEPDPNPTADTKTARSN
jgi:hypothetical protein